MLVNLLCTRVSRGTRIAKEDAILPPMKTSLPLVTLLGTSAVFAALVGRFSEATAPAPAGLALLAGGFVAAGVLGIAFADYTRATGAAHRRRPRRSFLARLVRREDRRLAA